MATPTITGSAEAGSTVTLTDGTTQLGTATADPTTGAYSITPTTPLSEGANALTATSTDGSGNTASGSLTVTLDTTPPAVTDSLAADGITVTGTGDPNATVTLANGGQTIGTAQADGNGAWSFSTAALAPDTYSLVASETDAAGNTGSAAPVAVTVPARFDITDTVSGDQSLQLGDDYPGPVNYLQAGYNYTGSDNSIISALVGGVFMHAGTSGENAEVALSGSNVLASGSGSSWLVGATGADGGDDTFFLSDQGTQPTWDTLVNFHVGDMLTLWDYNPASGSTTSLGLQGANAAQGDTIAVNFGNGSSSSTLVTFAGLPTSAQFTTTTGSTGGHEFLMMTRTA